MKQHIFLASPHMSDEGYEKEFVKEAFDRAFGEKCDGI